MIILVFSLAALIGTNGHVYPREYSSWKNGNQLYNDCLGKNGAQIAQCVGYIEGVSDALTAVASVDTERRFFCEPAGLIAQQLIDVVVAYLRSHPETRHSAAGEEVTLALMKAFPCDK